MIRNLFAILVISLVCILCKGTDLNDDKIPRKLSAKFNPDCPPDICESSGNKNILNLLHITADSDKDRLHHIWSFVGKPSLLIAKGTLDSNLTIEWHSFLGFENQTERSIYITPKPDYVTMTVLNRIFEFNDPEDTGDFVNVKDKSILSLDTSLFVYYFNHWKMINDTDNKVELSVTARKYQNSPNITNIGEINFTLQCYGTKGHSYDYPHLLHNTNDSQVDIVFDDFKIKKSFKSARLAVELMFATTDKLETNATFKISKRRTLDDEHTPGIFELDNLVSPNSYVEYRPVSYTHESRDVSTSIDTHLGNIITPNDTFHYRSLIFAYFGYTEDHLVKAVNISFGSVNDGFYKKTNYTSFTFLMGIGNQPTEEFSKMVIIIAVVGLGIPALLLMIGGTCLCVKRVRTYTRLSNGYAS